MRVSYEGGLVHVHPPSCEVTTPSASSTIFILVSLTPTSVHMFIRFPPGPFSALFLCVAYDLRCWKSASNAVAFYRGFTPGDNQLSMRLSADYRALHQKWSLALKSYISSRCCFCEQHFLLCFTYSALMLFLLSVFLGFCFFES